MRAKLSAALLALLLVSFGVLTVEPRGAHAQTVMPIRSQTDITGNGAAHPLSSTAETA